MTEHLPQMTLAQAQSRRLLKQLTQVTQATLHAMDEGQGLRPLNWRMNYSVSPTPWQSIVPV